MERATYYCVWYIYNKWSSDASNIFKRSEPNARMNDEANRVLCMLKRVLGSESMILNPHCRPDEPATSENLPVRFLNHGHEHQMDYTPRQRNEQRTILKHGQRKLLMSEIGLFLRTDPQKSYTAVYAGAAPGIHIPFLSSLFPNIRFHLFDPANFEIRRNTKIKIHQEFFTDTVARRYAERDDVIFISDIRMEVREQSVAKDMLEQKRWHRIINPEFTSLKFRLPWPGKGEVGPDNIFRYLDGEIVLPIWGRTSTTECRLEIVKGVHSGDRPYNCLVYEREMSHFNRITRPSVHAQPVRRGGLDGCFDCASEIALLMMYAERIDPAASRQAHIDMAAELSGQITRILRFPSEH